MYRLKHVPTGLYYQPHKQYGSNLSKQGKVYHHEGVARRVLGTSDNIFMIDVSKDSIVYKLSKDILVYREAKHSYNQMVALTNVSDWVVERIE